MVDNLSVPVHVFPLSISSSCSIDEILLQRYVKWSAKFRGFQFNVKMAAFYLKFMNVVLSEFTKKQILLAACSRLCCRYLT